MSVDFKTFLSVVPHIAAVCKPVLIGDATVLARAKWFMALLLKLGCQWLSVVLLK